MYYFLDVFWQGAVTSILLLLTAWYSFGQMKSIKTLDQGSTSFDYLKSFDRWLKEVLSRSEKIVRFSYPLYFLIAVSTIWSAWTQEPELSLKIQQKFPGLIFIGNIPLFALIIVGVAMLLVIYF